MKESTQKQAEKSLDSKLIFLLACLLKNENGEMVLGYFVSWAGLSHIYLHNKNLNAWQQTLRIDFTVIAVIQMKKQNNIAKLFLCKSVYSMCTKWSQ